MEITVVIPVFNKSHLTIRCLESLLAHSKDSHEIIIIDNASSDDTPDVLQKFRPRFERAGWRFDFVRNPQNVGFGRAMNQGAKKSRSEFLMLLNNDTWLLPDWDIKLISALKNLPEASMICPYINETKPFDSERLLKEGIQFQKRNSGRTRKTFSAVCMFFRREAFEKLNGFDERFFVTYEDTDLRERMDREHHKYYMVGDCVIWHQSMATRSDSKSLPSNYELEGKRLFFEKWGFDNSEREKKQLFRMKRRWIRFINRMGYL